MSNIAIYCTFNNLGKSDNVRNWENKIFRDNVHGYIKVPVPFARKIIDTEIFQRLRYIEQTGMRTLYPSARHDRFIHSLGTYHLGIKAYEAFRENVRMYYSSNEKEERNHYMVYKDIDENEVFWDKCKVLFSLACLLHDCGHAPFSHTLEYMYDIQKVDDGSDLSVLNSKLLKAYNSSAFKCDFKNGIGKEHERMSALFVKLEFGEAIREIVQPEFGDCSDEDIEFIARSIIGCKYKDTTTKLNQIKNCVIQLLNSSSIDVDGLDYIVRDAKLSGVDNVAIDVDRLIGSLTIAEKTHFDNCSLNDFSFDAPILNGKLMGMLSGNVSGVIDVDGFSGSIKGQIYINGSARITKSFQINHGYVKIGGVPFRTNIGDTEDVEKIEISTILSNDAVELNSGKFKSKEDLNVTMISKVDGSFKMESVYYKGKMTGTFSGVVLGHHFEGDNRIVEIALAFHKSSLSVLQNVVYARNYEYIWIYAHHKVVYYSNYLLIHTLRQSVRFLIGSDKETDTDSVLTKILSMFEPAKYKDHVFFRANDSDLIALFRECCLKNRENSKMDEDLDKTYIELFTRDYKKSIWKSYAEYNTFFGDLSNDEKNSLMTVIQDNTVQGGNTKLYGYFNEEWTKKFNAFGLDEVIWVNAEVSMKDLELDKTFILLRDKPMRLRDVSFNYDTNSRHKVRLFYLYYYAKKNLSSNEIKDVISFLKEEAREKAKMLS